jgi:hypothetical protein
MGSPTQYFVHTATPASPGLLGVLTNWDGQWYERIAVDGYPSGVDVRSPNDAWAWAFPPAFPIATRAVMAATGTHFVASAVTLNLVLGAIATLLVFHLFRRVVGDSTAVLAALLVNAFPSAPIFMLAFSEPMALALLLGVLLAVVRHRHWLTIPLVAALALTRPVAAPLAAVMVLHWWTHRRSTYGREGTRARVAIGAATVLCVASPWLWGFLSSALGAPSTPTSGADRTASIVRAFDFGWFGAIERAAGPVVLALFVALVTSTLALTAMSARRLGLPGELIAWGVSYIAFVLLVTPLHPAMLRYLLLAAPFLVALPLRLVELPRPVRVLALLLVAAGSLWLQWFWIRYVYILDPAPALLPFAA